MAEPPPASPTPPPAVSAGPAPEHDSATRDSAPDGPGHVPGAPQGRTAAQATGSAATAADGGPEIGRGANGSAGASDDRDATPAPDTPPERRVAQSLFEVILCSGFPTQLVLSALLAAAGLTALAPTGEPAFGFIVTLTLLDVVVVLGLVTAFLRARRESLGALVLGARPPGREAALGVLLVPPILVGAVGAVLLIGWAAPALRNVPDNPFLAMLSTPGRALLFTLVVVLAGGLREELQRAFILRRFDQHLGGGWLGLAVFSVAFGLGHAVQGWDTVIVTGALGAVWGTLYLTRGSAVAAMVSHAGFNVTQIVLAVAGAPP